MGISVATSPAKLGSLEFDAILENEEKLSAEAPTYATEAGFEIGDAIIIKSTELTVSAILSNSPVTWAHNHGSGSNRVREAIHELRSLFRSRELFTYSQNGETYDNMALTGLTIPDKADEYGCVTVGLTMKQITVTETQTTLVTISYPRGGITNTNTGSASTGSKSSSGSSSYTGNARIQDQATADKHAAAREAYQERTTSKSALYSLGSAFGLF